MHINSITRSVIQNIIAFSRKADLKTILFHNKVNVKIYTGSFCRRHYTQINEKESSGGEEKKAGDHGKAKENSNQSQGSSQWKMGVAALLMGIGNIAAVLFYNPKLVDELLKNIENGKKIFEGNKDSQPIEKVIGDEDGKKIENPFPKDTKENSSSAEIDLFKKKLTEKENEVTNLKNRETGFNNTIVALKTNIESLKGDQELLKIYQKCLIKSSRRPGKRNCVNDIHRFLQSNEKIFKPAEFKKGHQIDEGFIDILMDACNGKKNKKVTKLDFGDTQFENPKDIELLMKHLEKNQIIVALSLKNVRVDRISEFEKALVELISSNDSLTEIDLTGMDISGSELMKLTAILRDKNKKLQKLILTDNPRIEQAVIESLKGARNEPGNQLSIEV